MKKIDFWGRDENDERLLEEVVAGLKTATCTPKVWYNRLPEDEKSQIGDYFQACTKQGVPRAVIIIIDVYEIPFGEIKGKIGQRIAEGENCTLEEYIKDHISCWEEPLESEGHGFGDHTIIVVEHFKIVSAE
ncbi:ASCH domain-containing protein [Virgibacillus kekensis]|uniref:ASCH domain-containing protein n=1 Tax=Virgibacillus kekensis TaxID=202261 RepID=A0ABV9DI57_9BACI